MTVKELKNLNKLLYKIDKLIDWEQKYDEPYILYTDECDIELLNVLKESKQYLEQLKCQ